MGTRWDLSRGRLEIDVSSWGLNFGSEGFIVYNPAMSECSLYEESLILYLPSFDEILYSSDGKTGTLGDFLEKEPYVVYDTNTRIIGTMELFPAGAPYPLPYSASSPPPSTSCDTTPPDTYITDEPSGIITEKDATFTFRGSDSSTSTADLVYSCSSRNLMAIGPATRELHRKLTLICRTIFTRSS
jgi:hypothetical protein